MQIKQGGESPVNIQLDFTNVELQGLKDFEVTSIKYVFIFLAYSFSELFLYSI